MGYSRGTSTIMAALPSMNIPTNSRNRLTSSRNTYLLSVICSISSVMVWGMRSLVSTQDRAEAAPMIIMIPAVEMTVSFRPFTMVFQSISLYSRPRKMEYTTATVPASVAVNAPIRIPPMMTTGRIRGRMACFSTGATCFQCSRSLRLGA